MKTWHKHCIASIWLGILATLIGFSTFPGALNLAAFMVVTCAGYWFRAIHSANQDQ